MSSFVPSAITRPFLNLQTFMEVCMNHPGKIGIHTTKNLHEIHTTKIPWTMELAITRPFELKTRDFPLKFVWTIPKNGHPYNEKSMQEKFHGPWN